MKRIIAVADTSAAVAAVNNANRKKIFKVSPPFTDCITKINNTQIEKAKDIHVVMSMYHFMEYSNNYSKK